jgi:hypothetical protein
MDITSMAVSLHKSDGNLVGTPVQAENLSQANEWKEWAVLLDFNTYGWGAAGDYLTFEFDDVSGCQMDINGILFKGITEKEYLPQIFTVTGQNSGSTVLTRVSDTEFIIETNGTDPNITVAALSRALPAGAVILSFEYISGQTMSNNFQIYFGPSLSEGRSIRLGTVPPAAEWTKRTYDLTDARKTHTWGAKGDYMRFDIGEQPGYTIRIRNIHFEYKSN